MLLALLAQHKLAPSSFKAFYCAGSVVDRGADPYLVEPLRSCEQALASGALPSYAVEPAPFPGYVMAFWGLVARLPYPLAHGMLLALDLAALAAIAWAVSRLAGLPPALAALPFLSLWFLNVAYGEVPVVATAGLAMCALALRHRHWWLAAICAGVVAVEPHLALPLFGALLFCREVRLPIVVVGCVLLVVDVMVSGPGRAIEYFTHVVPLQAAAEVHANDQFSLSHTLALNGAGVEKALRYGTVAYAIMAVLGIWATFKLWRVAGATEYLALVPPAFVLLGGTFLHDIQFIIAMPLAIVLLARYQATPLFAAAILLCIPWASGASRFSIGLMFVSLAGVVWVYCRGRKKAPWEASIATALTIFSLALFVNAQPAHLPKTGPPYSTTIPGNVSASIDWRVYIENTPDRSSPTLRDFERKLPTWAGIFVLLLGVATLVGGQELAPRHRQYRATRRRFAIRRSTPPASAMAGIPDLQGATGQYDCYVSGERLGKLEADEPRRA